jgi:hypothetical protein
VRTNTEAAASPASAPALGVVRGTGGPKVALVALHSGAAHALVALSRQGDREPDDVGWSEAVADGAAYGRLLMGEAGVVSRNYESRCSPPHSSIDREPQERTGWWVCYVLRVASFEAGHARSGGWAVQDSHLAK